MHWQRFGCLQRPYGWAAVNPESTRYYEEARTYLKKGDINAAAIQLKNAIRADESNVDARFDLAAIYLARSDGASAEKELRAALAHGMARERALLPLAQALILQNKAEALLKEIDPGTLRGQDAAVLYGVRARAHLLLKQLDQAEMEIDKALTIEPKSGPALITMSQVLQSKGKFDEAEQAADQALAANPNLVDAHVQKGGLKQGQGDFTQALADFDRALALDAKECQRPIGPRPISRVLRQGRGSPPRRRCCPAAPAATIPWPVISTPFFSGAPASIKRRSSVCSGFRASRTISRRCST